MRFLKVINGLFIATVLSGGIFTSCSDEDLPFGDGSQNGESLSEPKNYYLAIDLVLPEPSSSASGTRATTWEQDGDGVQDGDYIYGTDQENGIGLTGHYIFFFGENKVLQMLYPLTLPNTDVMQPGVGEGNKIEIRYWTLIRDIEKENLPSYALVVLNGKPIYNRLLESYKPGTVTIDDVLKDAWKDSEEPKRIGRTEEGLFVMTNTSYLDGGEVYCAVPVTEKMYHEMIDINELYPPNITLPEDEILKVRVERMLAKVSLEMTGGEYSEGGSYIYTPEIIPATSPDYFDYNHQLNLCTGWEHTTASTQYTNSNGEVVTVTMEDWAPTVEVRDWKAEITGWDMNALEQETYLYKRIKASGYNSFFSGWNDASYYRSFWAEDPEYAETDYPLQFRRAVDEDQTYYATKYSSSSNTNFLNNYSYTQLNNPYFGRIEYIPENTYDLTKLTSSSLDERRDYLAGSHLILCAKLLIQNEVGSKDFKAIDVYRDRQGIYYSTAKDCLWGLVRTFNYSLGSQERMRYQYYDWSESSEGIKLYGVPDEGTKNYRLYYKGTPLTYNRIMDSMSEDECRSLLPEAEIRYGDGKRAFISEELSIQNALGDHLPIYSEYNLGADSETHQRYDNSQYYLRTSNDNIYDVWSLILEWSGAVDHFNSGLMYYPAVAKINNNVCGVVRNGWYKYHLTKVNSIGIPVDIPGQPIVPNWDYLSDGVNVTVEILGWHTIEGSLDILPNN